MWSARDDRPPPVVETDQRRSRAPKRVLKSSDYVWLVGYPCEQINTSTLPTRRQAYLRFWDIKNGDKDPTSAMKEYRENDMRFRKLDYNQIVAHMVLDEVKAFWIKGGYETKELSKCRNEVLDIHSQWQNLKKSKSKAVVGEVITKAREDFDRSLDGILDLNSTNWEKAVKENRGDKSIAETDIQFMKALLAGERTGGMCGRDMIHETVIKKRQKRLHEAEHRVEKERNRKAAQSQIVMSESDDDTEKYDNGTIDPDFLLEECSHANGDILLALTPDFLSSPILTEAADRLRLSNRQLARIIAALLNIAGANSNHVVLSRETIRRHRVTNREVGAEKIKNTYIVQAHEQTPFLALHWDGKIMKLVTGEKMDHLAILVSGGIYPEGKLLAALSIADGTGKTMSESVRETVDDWELTDYVKALVFDTTASNTGQFQGAATRLEVGFDRKLLWLAGRHHIYELVLAAAWKSLFGDTQSKDNILFKSFSDQWTSLDLNNPRKPSLTDPFLIAEKEKAIQILEAVSITTREDYAEAAKLGLVMLGALDSTNYYWRRPGAFHHARWMAHLLYGPKMFAFGAQCGYDREFMENLEIFIIWTCLFYLPYWFTSTKATEAPFNDLQFIQTNISLSSFVDLPNLRIITEAVVATMQRHTWYLCEVLVILVLFARSVDAETKKAIANALMSFERPVEFSLGKPQLPTILPDTELTDLLGPNSWFVFEQFNGYNAWLLDSPDTWDSDESYVAMRDTLNSLKVVNDPAERAIKLCSDFLHMGKDEKNVNAMMQVVEKDRLQFPTNCTKGHYFNEQ